VSYICDTNRLLHVCHTWINNAATQSLANNLPINNHGCLANCFALSSVMNFPHGCDISVQYHLAFETGL
jgi:hypothetical protein